MDSLYHRYRNPLVLIAVLLGQLLLLGYQVRGSHDMPLLRVWAVNAVTPVAVVLEALRTLSNRTIGDFIMLRGVREENRGLKQEISRLKLENQYLHNEISSADRARALTIFQTRTPSKTIAARVIGTGPGPTSKAVYVDRGTISGVQKGMAVVTPDGIVGKVAAAYSWASMVQLVLDPNFAASVISQKGRVRGIIHGQDGSNACRVDYVASEDKLETGEWFYTSGDDRVFPKGLPVGPVKSVSPGPQFKRVVVEPSGFQNGLEEVLIVIEAVHAAVPEDSSPSTKVYLAPPPPPEVTPDGAPQADGYAGTDADRLRRKYKAIGAAQGHAFGDTSAKPPDFNAPLPETPPPAQATGTPPEGGSAPVAAPAAKPPVRVSPPVPLPPSPDRRR